jgi:signal peptidase II|tara:strand:+ start:482 stop:982 length:501 start_codon:yes stop_codon:yes gene_type:complete
MNISKSFKDRTLFKNTIISMAVIVLIFILDRVSKIKIINHQKNNEGSLFINDYLNFDLVWNTGIGFGLFSQNGNIYYHGISLLIFLVIIFLSYLISRASFYDKNLYSLILGGALGNFYDRLFYFAVPDFIDIHVNDFHWFTFNIADIFITIGVISLISKDLFWIKK